MKYSPEALDAAQSILRRARRQNLTDSVVALAFYLEKLMRQRDRRLRPRRSLVAHKNCWAAGNK